MSVDAGTLARLNILVGMDDKQAAQAMKGLERRTQTLTKNMASIAGNLMKKLTLPLIAAGAGLLKMADTLDDGLVAIRLQTGATGETLLALGASYRRVLSEATQGAEDVGNALGFIQTRTGLVGEPLENLTTQILQLSRIGKTDLMTVANTATRTFGDWSIATDKQAGALDWLWKVSQGSGTSIDRLMSLVVQYGAPMRQLGFSFEQATAMLGKFEAEGVNTEVVMSSLRISLGRMAKEGVRDPVTELQKIIRYIKEAGSVGEANTIAMEVFGTKAGVDMAAAIREGRLDLDAFLKKIKGSEETIDAAAKAAEQLSEKLGRLRNKIILAAEPLGRELLVRVENMIPLIETNVAKLGEWIAKWDELSESTKKIVGWSLGFLVAAGPVLKLVLLISKGIALLTTTILGIPVWIITGFAAAVYLLWQRWDKIVEVMREAWEIFRNFRLSFGTGEGGGFTGGGGGGGGGGGAADGTVLRSIADDGGGAGSLELAAAAAAGVGGLEPMQVEHSGIIRVEGVDGRGQLVAVVDLLAEDIRADADRYANVPSERRQFK